MKICNYVWPLVACDHRRVDKYGELFSQLCHENENPIIHSHDVDVVVRPMSAGSTANQRDKTIREY